MSFLHWNKWEYYLKTFWHKHLENLKNKKCNFLEIGAYKGYSTCWILENLATNPESLVYAIDTWEGSPEYPDKINFKKIEKEFDENIKKTKKQNQVIKMKMNSRDGLIELIQKKIMFDFIYIDASHEAKDVISDAVLSWQVLKNGCVLIFDDYEWDILEQEYFRPKIAIDSFIEIFKPELKIVFVDYQVGVKKLYKDEFEKPQKSKYYQLIEKIDELKYQEHITQIKNINIDFKNVKLDFKTGKNFYEKIINSGSNKLFKRINKMLEDNNELYEKFFSWNIYDDKKSKNYYYALSFIYGKIFSEDKERIYHQLHHLFSINKKLDKNKKYDCLVQNRNFISTKIKNYLDTRFNNINFSFVRENQENKLNVDLLSDGHYNYLNLMKKYKCKEVKFDLLLLGYGSKYGTFNQLFKYKQEMVINLILNVLISLNLQKENGSSFIFIPIFFEETVIQLFYILKIFYDTIEFKNIYTTRIGTTVSLNCLKFNKLTTEKINFIDKLTKTFDNSCEDSWCNVTNIIDVREITKNVNYCNFKKKVLSFEENIINKINLVLDIYCGIKTTIKDETKILKLKKKLFMKYIEMMYVFYYSNNYLD